MTVYLMSMKYPLRLALQTSCDACCIAKGEQQRENANLLGKKATWIERAKCTVVRVLYRQIVNLYRSCVGLGWLAQETMGFILVWVSEE
jgi:hypothetical protein